MGTKFVGGPFDGKEADRTDVMMHAGLMPLEGDLGQRLFVLMPTPEIWDRRLRGEEAEATPQYLYEEVMTPDGPRFESAPDGASGQAWWESRLKVHQRARTALSTLSGDLRREIIQLVAALQRKPHEEWSHEQAMRISDDKPVYLVVLPNAMRAFVRVLDSGELELVDIMSEETLRLFQQRYAGVGTAE